MIHVGTRDTDVPPITHRKQLRQREDAWQCFGYKQKCTLQPQRVSESTIHVDSGVYGSVREDRIHFARLPSVSDADDEHSWSHPIDVVPLLAFTFCPEQDLFVVVTSSPDDASFLFDIHLRSLMTDEIHPNAAQSVLQAFDTDDDRIDIRRSTRTHPEKPQINGNYISFQCRDFDVDRVFLHMWDWKCRKGIQHGSAENVGTGGSRSMVSEVDFNPHDTCNDADDVTRRHGRLVQGTGQDIYYYPFAQPLGSALPYREIVSDEPFDDELETVMDESRILLLEASRKFILGPSAYNEV
ncbi:hypothetical protein K503DRAFT_802700 [Rhizopogon vinicolor AM-OR11-026]|uniref:Uncharacterized protein n=1 Tax=Rhizopogon vinicolor AM-OR11-026 TaxID=1314800 RepID=A0A1B7MSM2_9AGAM|nr:hypothetical protein K503DRAFT_802700 [Rhizopogon vinicolor AM-OR11-026]